MKRPTLNPAPFEIWYHPITWNQYVIHSLTDDGWVRYSVTGQLPLWTQPTLDFINVYKRLDVS